jgi:hypothetical protein
MSPVSLVALALALQTPTAKPWFEPAPPPLPAEPESARRALELVSSAGLGVPEARDGHAASAAGGEFGLCALHRATPYFAFGAALRLNSFGWPGTRGESGTGSAMFFGAAGRLYLREGGPLDPYLELDLGVASLSAKGDAGATEDRSSVAGSLRSAIGLDVWLGTSVRLGPSLGYTRYAPRKVERCTRSGCSGLAAATADLPVGLWSLAISLTFGAGDPL